MVQVGVVQYWAVSVAATLNKGQKKNQFLDASQNPLFI